MNSSGDRPVPEASEIVRLCRQRPEALAALAAVYADADAAGAGGLCLRGGTCCRFDLQPHRLFLTGLELAALAAEAPPRQWAIEQSRRGRCPYQIRHTCQAYARRPLGCRTFYCGAAARGAEGLHEVFHSRIREIHENFCIPYAYADLCRCFLQLFLVK